jgi:glycosyltransferase involved in cell wall biosynthesis
MSGPEPVRVSVIVPTKNRAPLLRQALASIRAIEGPDLSIELIVSDNGSVDDSRSVAAEFDAIWLETVAPGASEARNSGLKAATGEFIAFLDDDDVWLPGHLRPHLRLMASQSEIGAVIGQVRNASQDLKHLSDPWPAAAAPPERLFRQMLGFYPQIGGTVVKAVIAREVGWFDPALDGDEDWDWHLRLALTGRVGFVAEPCVLFRQRTHGQGDLEWSRMRFSSIVLLRNVRRAPNSAQLWLAAGRSFIRLRGAYAQNFLGHAARERAAGQFGPALRNFGRAMIASAPHTLKALCDPELWKQSRATAG